MREAATPSPRYFPGLDVIRALAALAVLACHAVQSATVWSPAWLAGSWAALEPVIRTAMDEAGAWGVGIFFVLSGLCIHLPLARQMAHGAEPKVDVRAYFSRRFRRIYPPHLVALGLSAVCAAALPLAAFGVHPMISVPTLTQLAAHLGMVHTFVPNAMYSINHVLWTIAVEAHFYMLYPLLLLVRRKRSMAAICAALFALSLATHGGMKVLDASLVVRGIVEQSVLCRLWEWVLGCCVAEWIAARGVALRVRPTLLFAALGTTLMSAIAARALIPYGTLLLALAMPAVFAVALLIACGLIAPESSALVRVGRASYSLYLVHPIALSVTIVALRAAGARSVGLELVAGVAVALTAANLFHRFVEVPFMARPQARVVHAVAAAR